MTDPVVRRPGVALLVTGAALGAVGLCLIVATYVAMNGRALPLFLGLFAFLIGGGLGLGGIIVFATNRPK